MKHDEIYKQWREVLTGFLISRYKNNWLMFKGGRVYVRKAQRLLENRLLETLDIASIQLDTVNQRTGLGTELVAIAHEMNPFQATYIENVYATFWHRKLQSEDWIPTGEEGVSLYKMREKP